MLFSMCLYPRVQKSLGPLKCCLIALIVVTPSSLLVPFASLLVRKPWAMNVLLYIAMGTRSVAKIMSFTSSSIILNTHAPKAEMGAVNGAANTMQNAARAIGPAFAGIMWAVTSQMTLAGHQFISFAAVGIGAVITQAVFLRVVESAGRD